MKQSLWQYRLFLWLAVVIAAVRAKTDVYDLPSFALVLNVDSSENSLIEFQDRLNFAVQMHLADFFLDKVKSSALVEGGVEKVELTSSYIWKELPAAQDSKNDQEKKYDVRSNFGCQLEIRSWTVDGDESRISQSIMDLFLIEAFQGEHYWALVHSFFKDEVLQAITGVTITVKADGYVHYNGQDPSAFNNYDDYNTDGNWTPAMTAGVIFATLLVVSLCFMWTYICCFTRDSIFLQWTRSGRKKLMEKAETATDDMHSTSTLNPEEEAEEGEWMDAWAKSVTSIPLRQPVKTRKSKKAPSIRHPAQHHNSYLNSIEEADDECSTVCSVESSPSHSTRKRNIATKTQEDDEQTVNTVLESRTSQPNYRFGNTAEQPFEYTTSQPQLESINELV